MIKLGIGVIERMSLNRRSIITFSEDAMQGEACEANTSTEEKMLLSTTESETLVAYLANQGWAEFSESRNFL